MIEFKCQQNLEIVDRRSSTIERPARSIPRGSQSGRSRAPIYRGWENPRYPHPTLEETVKYGIAIAVQRTPDNRWQLLENSVPTLIGDSPSNVLTKFIASQVSGSNSGAEASAPKVFKASESDELYEKNHQASRKSE